VEYGFLDQAKKSRNEMLRRGLAPVVDYEIVNGERRPKYSTLFCPAGFEFFEQEQEEIVKRPGPQSKGIIESEYLQFYIPKTQITGIYKNQSSGDLIMSHPDLNKQTSDENVMLEVWCKIFHVRELSTNINI